MNKSFQKQVILLISLLIFLVSNASATHYAGGELTWKCVMEGGVSKYKFKLIVYRNCARPDGTPAADIGNVGDLSTIQVDNLNGVLSQTLNTGRSGGEWVIVGVDGWLLMMWVWLVVVGVAAVARRGSRRVDGGGGQCGWGCWWSMGLDGGVPYFPMECLPFWLGYCVGECRVCVIWGCWENATSV